MNRTDNTVAVIEAIATIIAPDWFPDEGPVHVLNNYPGQADKLRNAARAQGRKIVELLDARYADQFERRHVRMR